MSPCHHSRGTRMHLLHSGRNRSPVSQNLPIGLKVDLRWEVLIASGQDLANSASDATIFRSSLLFSSLLSYRKSCSLLPSAALSLQ